MNTPAWQIVVWKPWFATVPEFERLAKRMRHLGVIIQTAVPGQVRRGQVLWGTEHEQGLVGIAWDWGDAAPDAPALSDPMTLLSNVHLLDDEGCCLPRELGMLYLNGAVNRFDWQRQVRAAAAPAWAEPIAA